MPLPALRQLQRSGAGPEQIQRHSAVQIFERALQPTASGELAVQGKCCQGRQTGQGQRRQSEAGLQFPRLRCAVLPTDGELGRCMQNRTVETIKGHDPGGLRPGRPKIPLLQEQIALLGQIQGQLRRCQGAARPQRSGDGRRLTKGLLESGPSLPERRSQAEFPTAEVDLLADGAIQTQAQAGRRELRCLNLDLAGPGIDPRSAQLPLQPQRPVEFRQGQNPRQVPTGVGPGSIQLELNAILALRRHNVDPQINRPMALNRTPGVSPPFTQAEPTAIQAQSVVATAQSNGG